MGGLVIHASIFIAIGNSQLPNTFQFSEDEANPFYSNSQFSGAQFTGNWIIHMIARPNNYPNLTFKFVRKGKEVVAIPGHTRSVFCADDSEKVLFFAQFPHNSTGCTILAYDLRTGKELWKTRLHALGKIEQIDRLRYSNKVNLTFGGSVWVSVRESFGDYIEALDPRTGKIIAHKVYRKTD